MDDVQIKTTTNDSVVPAVNGANQEALSKPMAEPPPAPLSSPPETGGVVLGGATTTTTDIATETTARVVDGTVPSASSSRDVLPFAAPGVHHDAAFMDAARAGIANKTAFT